MHENEKLVLSLEFLGTKRVLLEGPKGSGDCIFTVFFARLLRGQKAVATGWVMVIVTGFGPPHLAR